MARYLVVAIDDNDKATGLMNKLNSWPGFTVVGIFGKPMNFCECTDRAPNDTKRGRKFGYYVHKGCGLPVTGSHYVSNLMYPDIMVQHQPVSFTIREPYQTPVERWGEHTIGLDPARLEAGRKKLARWRRKNRA